LESLTSNNFFLKSGKIKSVNTGKFKSVLTPEIPGANGQGKTKEECEKNLAAAVSLILEEKIVVT